MNQIDLQEVTEYVESHIGTFHQHRVDSLKTLKLSTILRRKNPYLFRAKYIQTNEELVKTLLDAHLSSQEEGVFGDFLEGLAIFINEKVYDGRKSSTEGIDLEFESQGNRYIVAIKSGPRWGNAGQIKNMKDAFNRATRILRARNPNVNVISVNGCCYGRDNKPDKGVYYKYCGQKFWEFISGDSNLYLKIIQPLGHKAKEKNQEFIEQYSKIINLFTSEFCKSFCKNGMIDWDALVKFNSSSAKAT
jgi:hypothetical protein